MKDDKLYLIHIKECIQRIDEYTAGGQDAYIGSTLIQDAVTRNLQVLAESSQRVSESLKASYPDVPWRDIAGFRNVLVHQYLGIDLEYVWRVIEDDLPALKQQVLAMLGEAGQ